MSPKDANPAVTLAKTMAEAGAKCLTLSVLPAARTARFPSSPAKTAPFIAAIVFLTKDKQDLERYALMGRIFLPFIRFLLHQLLYGHRGYPIMEIRMSVGVLHQVLLS